MNYLKKISYLIFAMIIELLLGNFLFSMNENSSLLSEVSFSADFDEVINSADFPQNSLTAEQQKKIENLLTQINHVMTNLDINKTIHKTLKQLKKILSNPQNNTQELKKIKSHLRELIKKTLNSGRKNCRAAPFIYKLGNENEVHASLIPPLAELKKLIAEIDIIIKEFESYT